LATWGNKIGLSSFIVGLLLKYACSLEIRLCGVYRRVKAIQVLLNKEADFALTP